MSERKIVSGGVVDYCCVGYPEYEVKAYFCAQAAASINEHVFGVPSVCYSTVLCCPFTWTRCVATLSPIIAGLLKIPPFNRSVGVQYMMHAYIKIIHSPEFTMLAQLHENIHCTIWRFMKARDFSRATRIVTECKARVRRGIRGYPVIPGISHIIRLLSKYTGITKPLDLEINEALAYALTYYLYRADDKMRELFRTNIIDRIIPYVDPDVCPEIYDFIEKWSSDLGLRPLTPEVYKSARPEPCADIIRYYAELKKTKKT